MCVKQDVQWWLCMSMTKSTFVLGQTPLYTFVWLLNNRELAKKKNENKPLFRIWWHSGETHYHNRKIIIQPQKYIHCKNRKSSCSKRSDLIYPLSNKRKLLSIGCRLCIFPEKRNSFLRLRIRIQKYISKNATYGFGVLLKILNN